MQRKPKGFLYLDTHAGRGGYDLSMPAVLPDGRSREPEHPAGIGRLWADSALPPLLAGYVALVRRFNDRHGATGPELKFYPGSPWLAKMLLRPADRMGLCELAPDAARALGFEFPRAARGAVRAIDACMGVKALLPRTQNR